MAVIRTFIAVSISEEARKAVAQMILDLQELGPGLRWVKPENLHLTLKFLGNVDEQRLPVMEKALNRSTDKIEPFNYRLFGVGCFPNAKRARVLWIGVEDSSNQLIQLQKNIETRFSDINFSKETRKFRPHLTIARVKDNRKSDLTIPKDYDFGEFNNQVKEVLLMKSVLLPFGATYSKLFTACIR